MIKKINEYLSKIIDRLYSNKDSAKINKKVLHTILKNELTAKAKVMSKKYFLAAAVFGGQRKVSGGCQV